jgi:hypothetical protein
LPLKKVLIVSPHFPPLNAPDMQRVRMSLPYYPEHGWEPVVLAVAARYQAGVFEPALAQTVPGQTRIEWSRAFSPAVTRRFGFGSLGLRSWFHLWRRGRQLLGGEHFDLVFFSTTQFTCVTLGPLWKRRFGVPYVVDVQDPWRTDYYERPGSRRPPGGWKYQFARLEARLFEGWAFGRAAAVMSVSPRYLEDLRGRYPGFERIPSAVIPFGASAADLEHAARLAEVPYRFDRDGDRIHLLYTGASGPVMPHALNVLFAALRTFRERQPAAARRLRFHFVGTSYAPAGRARPSVLPIAAAHGVADQVSELSHRIGLLESLRVQQEADVLLVLGSSDLAYSPSKIYNYYLTRRPILALVFRDSVMERVLDELACACIVRFREREPKDEAHAALETFFGLLLAGRAADTQPTRNEAAFRAGYLAAELTRRQCELFARALLPPP